MRILTILLVVLATEAHAQQRGYYWNRDEQRWTCQVDCLRRDPPPDLVYPPPQQRNLYEEYRTWGGRRKEICYRPNGQAYYCYY